MQAPVFDVTEAISYKRFSSARQAKGNSIARQSDQEEKYAANHGLRIMDTYLDAGSAASTARMPILALSGGCCNWPRPANLSEVRRYWWSLLTG